MYAPCTTFHWLADPEARTGGQWDIPILRSTERLNALRPLTKFGTFEFPNNVTSRCRQLFLELTLPLAYAAYMTRLTHITFSSLFGTSSVVCTRSRAIFFHFTIVTRPMQLSGSF